MERVLRHVDAHDIFKLHVKLNALARIQKRLLEHLGAHDRACDLQGGKSLRQPLLDALAQLLVKAHDVHELTHQLIALILHKLMAAACSLEPALELL